MPRGRKRASFTRGAPVVADTVAALLGLLRYGTLHGQQSSLPSDFSEWVGSVKINTRIQHEMDHS